MDQRGTHSEFSDHCLILSDSTKLSKKNPKKKKKNHFSPNYFCFGFICRYVSIKCTPESSDHLQSFLAADKAWVNWIWGLVALVPLVIQRLLTLTKETEAAAETVEKVADTVEKVAEDVEKLAEDVSEKLPQGGKLKQVVDFVENVAKETAKDARSTEDLMNKVEEVDQQIESIITHGSKANVQESSKDQA
ncbi:OLC1v1017324C2 [Oldenlandia corymbosa var. corymbosa]|uniref:OLC1v1017324C2 n=1 Tax=Oldenlandia corymbosa var. corymbosa TaxID=529605 RepID=A0AAV1E983_OLDCO|nr:OLC1v1017324C2 [Oldenlandia corymbosa var. corymbosa]